VTIIKIRALVLIRLATIVTWVSPTH